MKIRSAALIIAAFGLTACVPPDPVGPQGPPDLTYPDELHIVEVYSLRSFSGMASKQGRIINNTASLQAAWDSVFVHYNSADKPPVPPIDFEHYVILLASAGPIPTQLLWFRIMRVRERQEHVAVLVESHYPPCGGPVVTTNPVHIVMIPRVATQAVYTFIDNVEPCK